MVEKLNPIKLILVCTFLLICNLGFGQSCALQGQIIDSENQESISGASVSITGTNVKVIADLDGYFRLTLTPGVYKIRVSMISYETVIQTIEIKNNASNEFKIKLNHVNAVNSKEAEAIILKQLISHNPGTVKS